MKRTIDLGQSINIIHSKLQPTREYAEFKALLFQKLIQSKTPLEDWHSKLSELASATQIDNRLRQFISQMCQQTIKKDPIREDNHDSINHARQAWTELLIQNIITLSNQIIMQMGQKKTSAKISHGERERREAHSDDEEEEREVSCIFDATQFLHALMSVEPLDTKHYNHDHASFRTLIKCVFPVLSVDEYKRKYSDLSPKLKSFGSEDETNDFVIERERAADTLIKKGLLSEIEVYLRRGAPDGRRSEIYKKILGIDTDSATKRYKEIKEPYQDHKYIIDDVIKEDSMLVLNDDKYFIFEDVVLELVQTLIRDRDVVDKIAISQVVSFTAMEESDKIIPLSGIIPCKYFARYATPFCYLGPKPEDCYFVFREFFCRHFSFLLSIHSHHNSILRLGHLFETLMITADPNLYKFMTSQGADPLKIAFPWMMYCFIGYLGVEQIFLLLDRLLGYNDLELVPILAASIIVSRKADIVKSRSYAEIDKIFHSLTWVKVIPSIQAFLFSKQFV